MNEKLTLAVQNTQDSTKLEKTQKSRLQEGTYFPVSEALEVTLSPQILVLIKGRPIYSISELTDIELTNLIPRIF